MLLLKKSDVQQAISMKEAISVVGNVFASYSAGETKVPIRTQIEIPGESAVSLYMPGFVEDQKALGAKIVSVFPKNKNRRMPTINSIVILADSETGVPIAAMEGSYLTALRTGAASGVATKYLARQDAAKVAIIGTGVQGRTQLEAVCSVRGIRQVSVFNISEDKAREFTKEMQDKLRFLNMKFFVASSPAEAVKDADIICTATTSKKPVFPADALKAGAHINAVGAFTPDMQEIGDDVLAKVDKVCVDSVEAVLEEAGDLIIPIKKGLFKKEAIYGEIGEIVAGKLTARENDEEITMFKSVGLSAQDVSVGKYILLRSMEMGLGVNFDLMS
ncbi:MAG: ornithine cyclodeaminase family protein [Clostridiales bacterium]|jgi:alanine dehydrogenase|nr:ornithine cyclodeaminase family protein [Clostridiales bacterium]